MLRSQPPTSKNCPATPSVQTQNAVACTVCVDLEQVMRSVQEIGRSTLTFAVPADPPAPNGVNTLLAGTVHCWECFGANSTRWSPGFGTGVDLS